MSIPPDPALFTAILFLKFQEHVRAALKKSTTLFGYTPHGLSHIQGVEASIDDLCTFIPEPRKLSKLESVLLDFCAWAHDLGMIRSIADEYQTTFSDPATDLDALRKQHDHASAQFLQVTVPTLIKEIHKELNGGAPGRSPEKVREDMLEELIAAGYEAAPEHVEFFRDEDNIERWGNNAVSLAHTVALIARYHRRAEPIQDAHPVRYFMREPVRIRFLAALFRLADALHVDRTRFERSGYDMLAESPQFSEESRVHWIKSFIVSSIRIDKDEHTVHVQADIPAEIERRGGRAGIPSDRLESMLTYIVNDLKEDVVSVSRILLKEELPSILGVTYDVHEIPAMQYRQDVRTALSHLLAMSSPNTSRLTTIALDVLRWHLDDSVLHNQTVEALGSKIDRQIASLTEQLEERPCHEALRKIHDLLCAIRIAWSPPPQQPGKESFAQPRIEERFPMLHQHDGQWRTLYALLEGVHFTFDRQRASVKDDKDGKQELAYLFNDCTDIVLYGYSEQVLVLLRALKHRFEKPPRIHVLECRTKTAYAAAGDLIYLDGQLYSRAIKKDLQYAGAVSLEPDAALARILWGVEPGKKAVVLLGSNAMYPDRTFVHSMGHLTVAAVAKSPSLKDRCKVIVLTDSNKIGYDHGERPTRERHPDRWLTHNKQVVEHLKEAGVELHNWQEDTVPMELLDEIVVLDGPKVLPPTFDMEAVRFDPPARYFETLKIRLLASYLSFMKLKGWLPDDVRREIEDKKKLKDKEDINLGNWRVAEAYMGKTQLPDSVRNWIETAWERPTSGEIARLTKSIRAEYDALVERRRRRRGVDDAEERTAEVIDIAGARLPISGGEPSPPAPAPASGDGGLVQPSPGA